MHTTTAPALTTLSLDEIDVAPPRDALSLPSGRRVTADLSRGEALSVTSPDGALELSVRFTPDGPVLTLHAKSLHLRADGDLSVDCDHLALRARKGVAVETPGDLALTSGGALSVDGASVAVEAHHHDLTMLARQEVIVDGQAIRLG